MIPSAGMELAPRRCAVCGRADAESLRTQGFLLPGERRTGYDVVACSGCGFAFARPHPGFAEALDSHYRESRKYAYEGSGNVAAGLSETHEASAAYLAEQILGRSPPLRGEATPVLDVGCATGQLLHFLARRGFADLTGLDPAPECRAVARRLLGLEVVTGTPASFEPGRTFGAVVLWNVLEHVLDLDGFLAGVDRLLGPDGVLFVQLPDAARFGLELDEPFQELSVEHVNYFTARSLTAILARRGLRPVELRAEVARSGGSRGAVLTAAFRRGDAPDPGPSDPAPLATYLGRSAERLAAVSAAVDALVASGEEVVVWGAGALAARLLVDTSLARARIAAFVDSDSALHGRTLARRPVLPPGSLRGAAGAVLVASVRWEAEIRATLEGPLGFRGRVLTLGGPPPSRS